MTTYNYDVYEVSNTYVSSGADSLILSVARLNIEDFDSNLDNTLANDPGGDQTIALDGVPVDSYSFFYDDTAVVGGVNAQIKTFQLVIGGVTRSFILGVNPPDLGAGVGDLVDLTSFAGYTDLVYGSIPCFTPGALIRTPEGARAVETLAQGDLVETQDHGPQPVRWVGRRRLSAADVSARRDLAPVVIGQGALGRGLPARELTVSPQHRMLVRGLEVSSHFGLDEALAPAVALLGRDGVRRGDGPVDYIHILFDRHEIIWAEDAPTESFFPGQEALSGLETAVRAELTALFPQLDEATGAGFAEPARPFLSAREGRALNPTA